MQSVDYLSEHAEFETHQYAIIDRVLFNQLPEAVNAIELITPLTAPQAHLYPWLIPLREVTGSQWRNLIHDIQLANDPEKMPAICLLLKSELSPDAMKNSLLNMLTVKDEYKRRHTLRFYDPRVLFHLHWMLSSWEFQNKFNMLKIPFWTFWLEGRWHTLKYERRFPLDVSSVATSFNKIKNIGLINHVLARLPLISDIEIRIKTSRYIDNFLEQCPLFYEKDKLAFARHGVIYGADFWKTDKISMLINDARNASGYYTRATSSWSEDDWSEALNEKNQRPKRIW